MCKYHKHLMLWFRVTSLFIVHQCFGIYIMTSIIRSKCSSSIGDRNADVELYVYGSYRPSVHVLELCRSILKYHWIHILQQVHGYHLSSSTYYCCLTRHGAKIKRTWLPWQRDQSNAGKIPLSRVITASNYTQ